RHLAAELVGRPGFAFADAFDLGSVQRVDLRAALAMVLEAPPHRQGEQIGEALPECLIVHDLVADVADYPAEAGAQEFEFAPRSLELVRVGVAPTMIAARLATRR